MRKALVLLRFSLGQLLAGRRLLWLALLVGVPLLLPALASGSAADPAAFTRDLVRELVLPLLLPVVSAVLATSALGGEVRDGTITNLVLKPVPRLGVVLAKWAAASLATLALLLPAVTAAHLLAARGPGSGALLRGTLVATTVGALAYCALGALASLLMGRALLVMVAYTLLWERGVASVAPSAASLSVRGYTEGILAATLDPAGLGFPTRLGPVSATALALAVTLLALALAARRLARMDLA